MSDSTNNRALSAVALRKAAITFGLGTKDPVKDQNDTAGQQRNRALLRAAKEYAADVFEEAIRERLQENEAKDAGSDDFAEVAKGEFANGLLEALRLMGREE
jgi:hypothetical protein